MNPFKNMKTEVLRNILAAYTASYGRMLTEEEAYDYKETIKLITLELASRENEPEDPEHIGNSRANTDSYMSGWF